MAGRPHRPSRPLSATAPLGCHERIGWLLRANRRYGPDGRDVRLAPFAAKLTAAGCPVTAGQVSRWESGRVPVPHRAVAAYERVLGLPRDTLVTVVDAVHRQHTPRLAPSRLERRVDPDDPAIRVRAEDLLDRALYGGVMTGAHWDELTVLLTAVGTVLMPRRHWDTLTQRLLSEQLVADGDAWRQRSESTHRLLWLPASRRQMVAACAAVVRDPSSQIVVEPLAILDVVDDPAAAGLLVEQLTAPVTERALHGALLACAARARHGLFSPPHLRRVRAAAHDRLADPSAAPLAARLLGHVPPGPGGPPGRPPGWPPGDGRLVPGRIAGWVLARTAAYADGTTDEVLARVVGETLFGADSDVRLHAAQLAGATPFRRTLADAYCAELRRPAVLRDPVLAGALLGALPFVAGPDHRRTVERVIVTPGVAAGTASAAAWCLAHVPGSSTDRFWAAALGRRDGLQGLVYALGIAEQHTWLARVGRDTALPWEARAAARWWAGLPATLTREPRRR